MDTPNRRQDRNDSAEPAEPTFPMRINKFLALEGRGSRREMDSLIADGKVLVNGKPAVLGQKVDEGDRVEIRFRRPE